MSNIDDLKELSNRLGALIGAPEPGATAWHEAVRRVCADIGAFATMPIPPAFPCSCGDPRCRYDSHHGNTAHLPADHPATRSLDPRPEGRFLSGTGYGGEQV